MFIFFPDQENTREAIMTNPSQRTTITTSNDLGKTIGIVGNAMA